jgi:hypothetical protein
MLNDSREKEDFLLSNSGQAQTSSSAWSIVKIACKMAIIQGESEEFFFFPPFRGIQKMILGKRKKTDTDTRPHELHAYVEEERRKGERER